MLERYFKYPRVLRRLRGGGLGDELDRIAAYLFDNGYRRASAKIYLSRLGRFSGFVSRAARGRPIPQSVIDSFVAERPTEVSRVAGQTAVALARRIVPQRFEPRWEEPDPHTLLLASCFWIYPYPAFLRYAAHSAGGY
jgi:integrase/recombinase XerD